jgi:hypothetical protein
MTRSEKHVARIRRVENPAIRPYARPNINDPRPINDRTPRSEHASGHGLSAISDFPRRRIGSDTGDRFRRSDR